MSPEAQNISSFFCGDDFFGVASKDTSPLMPNSTLEVPIETLAVSLPDSPISINGADYNFEIHPDRISEAVRHMKKSTFQPRLVNPVGIKLSLGESLPSYIEGAIQDKPERLYEIAPPRKNILNGAGIINLVLPAEIIKSNTPDLDLVKSVQESLNRDVEKGLSEMRYIKSVMGLRKFNFFAGMAIAGATGEGLMLTNTYTGDHNLVENALTGAGGALIGATAFLGFVAGKSLYNKKRYGSDTAALTHRMLEKIDEDRAMIDEGRLTKRDKEQASLFSEPLISLRRSDGKDIEHIVSV